MLLSQQGSANMSRTRKESLFTMITCDHYIGLCFATTILNYSNSE